jgi:hypothetical protein
MGQLLNQNPNQGWSGDAHTHDVLNVYLNSQSVSGNYSNATMQISIYHDSGYSEAGGFNGQGWVAGVLAINASPSETIGTGEVVIGTWTGTIGHDTNGNASPYMEYYVNQPATSMSRRGANWGLPRIPLAPSFSDVSVEGGTITPTTATLQGEISGIGHGTSATWEMFYKLNASSTWISLGQQADAVGYNYWTPTGLIPGQTYNFYATCFNNNGDLSTSSTSNFTTLSVPALIPILLALIG